MKTFVILVALGIASLGMACTAQPSTSESVEDPALATRYLGKPAKTIVLYAIKRDPPASAAGKPVSLSDVQKYAANKCVGAGKEVGPCYGGANGANVIAFLLEHAGKNGTSLKVGKDYVGSKGFGKGDRNLAWAWDASLGYVNFSLTPLQGGGGGADAGVDGGAGGGGVDGGAGGGGGGGGGAGHGFTYINGARMGGFGGAPGTDTCNERSDEFNFVERNEVPDLDLGSDATVLTNASGGVIFRTCRF